jgi:arylformamidase
MSAREVIMKIYDITMPLSRDLPTFPGDPRVQVEPVTRIARGDAANVSRIVMATHSGTHIDAPLHFDDRGVPVDHIPLTLLVGKALLVEIHGVRQIGRKELARLPIGGEERLLIRTGNSLLWDRPGFVEDYAHLTPDGVEYLLETGVRLVGIDYLSVEAFDGTGEIHRSLLGNGVVILEGLKLDGIPAGKYELICLPMKIAGGDGAPVRAILRGREEASGEFEPHSTRWPLS